MIRLVTCLPESSVAFTEMWICAHLWLGGQSTLRLGLIRTITGGCVSSEGDRCTVTVNVPVAVLPSSSAAAQVTTVVPTGKLEPEAGWQTTAGTEQLSVAETLNCTTALDWFEA